ncbi:MAG: riboflavin biosynthesis protein RibF [Myxococcota bacterium]
MRILPSSRNLNEPAGPYVIGLGIFDGVHLGHQRLLRKVRDLALAECVDSLVYTFDPHPTSVLSGDDSIRLLEPIESRLEQIAELWINTALIERFDAEFAAITARSFIDDILVGKLRVLQVVVGAGFTFGAGQDGNTGVLAAGGKRRGFGVHVVDPLELHGAPISSTRIRDLVQHGDVRQAARLLGRTFALVGMVGRGAMRGRRIGIATANLTQGNEIVPATGVYVGHGIGGFGKRPAVINIGFTPTFAGQQLKVEAHLLDYDGADLYGQPLTLQLVDRLRDERRFEDAAELKAQIERDIVAARDILAAATDV